MSGPERRFLGWGSPPMIAAAGALLAMAPPGRELDLSGLLVVVQGGRAGRNLKLHLVEGAERAGRALVPPRIETPAGLLEALLPMRGVAAPPLVRWWAWAGAVKALPPEARRAVLAAPPGDDTGWLRVGAMFEEAAAALAARGFTFASAAAKAGEAARFSDADRWEVLPEVERAALESLAAAGFEHPHLRRVGSIAEAPGPIVLACVSDLSALARRALAEAARTASVVALVAAPGVISGLFDEFGCPAAAWADETIDIDDRQVRVVDDATDEADAALEAIADLAAEPGPLLAPDRVIIAAPDSGVIPRLERRAELAGARVRSAAGTPLINSRPATLLACAADLCASRTFRALGTFVRHADAEPRLAGMLRMPSHAWLAAMDAYEARHLPHGLGGGWPESEHNGRSVAERVAAAAADLLGALHETVRRAPAEWAEPIVAMLTRVYGGAALDPDIPGDAALAGALGALRDHAATLRECPEGWGELTGAEAIRAVLLLAEEGALPPPPDPEAVEVVGWLEAPLDDAPVAIVTGMNEGFVPGREATNPLLPEAVRAALGMANPRPARDAFLLTLLLRTRPHVRLIAGRRGPDGEAGLPSRLLMRCPRADLPRRVLLWAPPEGAPPRPPRRPPPAGVPGAAGRFVPMPLAPSRPARGTMSVTDFGAYLRSPYLYYLERELRLREVPERPVELDRRAFGDLLHAVLQAFAAGAAAGERDASKIERFVLRELERLVREQHGPEPAPAVVIQAAQARERLKGFARWQAERASQGWRIERWEWQPEATLDVDGEPMPIVGRIDRVDRHDEHGWALLDYKSGDHVKDPEQKHRHAGEWTDLQLPLYRLLARSLTGEQRVSLGYVLLPASAKDAGLREAAWDDAALDGALEAAREVVRRIRRGEFQLVGDFPPEEGTFAALCGTLHVGGEPAEDAQGREGEGDADD